jgi:DNA primase catalytic core
VADKLGLELHKEGKKYQGDCPTGHASSGKRCFTVNPENKTHREHSNYFYCFSCGISGDAVKLVEIVKNISNSEAIDWLLDQFNLKDKLKKVQFQFKTLTPEQKQQREVVRTTGVLYQEAYEWMKELLSSDSAQLEFKYLTEERKYSLEDICKSEWCYFPKEETIKKYLTSKFPHKKGEIAKLSLRGRMEDFSHLAFPYRDRRGNITGFVKRFPIKEGRLIEDKPARWDSTSGVNKNDLFNIHACKGQDALLVVEGYPDALIFTAMGMYNVVAVGQGRLSESHIEGLEANQVSFITISFDNDDVGPGNTEKAVAMLLDKSLISPYVLDPIKLNPHKDPDEYVKANGLKAFKELLKEIELGASWVCNRYLSDYNSADPIEKERIFQKCLSVLVKLKKTRDQTALLKLLSEKLKLTERQIKDSLKQFIASNKVNSYGSNKIKDSERYLPFIEKKTSQLAYFDRVKGSVHLGLKKDILEAILASAGQVLPEVPFVFEAEFDTKDNERVNLVKEQFNLFVPTKYMLLDKTEQKINPMNEFPTIYRLLTNLIPVYRERKLYLNWLAGILQTRDKQLTAWVFRGEQGAGKGLMLDKILKPLFGRKQVIQVEDQQLYSEFNPWLQNTMLVAFNEVACNSEARNKVNSRLKAIITDNEIQINEKNVRQFYITNYVNCIFFSNEAVPIYIEDTDRRFNVVQTSGNLQKQVWFSTDPETFIARLSDELPQFAQFLMNWKYDPIKAKTVFENETKSNMVSSAMNRFEEFAKYLKNGDLQWFRENASGSGLFEHQLHLSEVENRKIEKRHLRELFEHIYTDSKINEVHFGKRMTECGIKSTRLVNSESTKTSYYIW